MAGRFNGREEGKRAHVSTAVVLIFPSRCSDQWQIFREKDVIKQLFFLYIISLAQVGEDALLFCVKYLAQERETREMKKEAVEVYSRMHIAAAKHTRKSSSAL